MRRSLRSMVDSGELAAASPMAKHVSKHLSDPVGETQGDFEDLTKKMIEYNVAKENMKRKLLPVQSVLDHVNQMHQMDPLNSQNGQDPNSDAGMGYTEDQTLPQNMNQRPGAQQLGKPQNARLGVGAGPNLPPTKTDPTGPPMKQNMKVPVPGAATQGAQTQVRPAKMGVPRPGQSNGGTRAANPGQNIPGRKSAKPAGKKPAFGNSKVAIHIHSDKDVSAGGPGYLKSTGSTDIRKEIRSEGDRFVRNKGRRQLEAGASLSNLRF